MTTPKPGARFASACAASAFGVPLLLAASRLAASGGRFDDLQLVRGLGMVPAGGEGLLSALLIRVSALLPLGGQPLRAGFLGALVLGAIGFLTFRLAEQLLARAQVGPRLNALLSVSAALTASLSPAAQLGAGSLGSVTVATLLALLGLVTIRGQLLHERSWLGFGALVACCTAEHRGVGLALALALALQTIQSGNLPSRRAMAFAGIGFASVGGIWLLVTLVRARAEGAWLMLGAGIVPLELAVPIAHSGQRALSAWLAETGVLALGLATLGAAYGLFVPRLRALTAALLAFVTLDAALGAGLPLIDADSCRLLAVCALSVLATLGVQLGLLLFSQLRLPFAEPVSVLLVVFHMTLACSAIEDSAPPPGNTAASEGWTDEALGRLPARSLLLVREPGMAFCAWSARVVRGERPDVVVVPLSLLGQPNLASKLLAAEPNLAPLIRDLSINGAPSAHALSQLADARPLFVDFDPRWPARLHEHLVPGSLWLRFSPHPLGRSDRARALERTHTAVERLLPALGRDTGEAAGRVRAALAQRLREQSALLAALGDRDSVKLALADLERVLPGDGFGKALNGRLAEQARGRVDVTGLLASTQ